MSILKAERAEVGMSMVKLCNFAPGQNLTPVREHLEAHGLSYQLRNLDGAAELWVDDQHLEAAAGVLDGLIRRGSQAPAPSLPKGALAAAFLRTWPVTIMMIALGVAGFLVVSLRPGWISVFTFTEVALYTRDVISSTFRETFVHDHQWWRLMTPAFLHFGIWHVLFNSFALWELGRRLEFVLPRHFYLLILLLTGIAANLTQHWLPGSSIFGGLSGIVFGLFGVIAVLYLRTDSPVLKLPKGLYILALVSLAVLPFVLKTVFGIHVANGAHLGGLAAGLLLGVLLPVQAVRHVQLPPI